MQRTNRGISEFPILTTVCSVREKAGAVSVHVVLVAWSETGIVTLPRDNDSYSVGNKTRQTYTSS